METKRGNKSRMPLLNEFILVYSETLLREEDILSGFIIGLHNLNNIRYAADAVLRENTERKLQEVLVKESGKKGQIIICKKTEYI